MGKKNRGMSLVGVLAAIGISSVVLVGMLEMFNNQLLGQKHVEQKYSVVYLNNEIYQLLSQQNACVQSFGFLSAFNYTLPTSDSVFNSIKQLKSGAGSLVYRTYNDPDPATTPSKVYENNSVQINSFVLSGYTPDETPSSATDPLFYVGKGRLKIQYEKLGRSLGPRFFERELKLSIELKKCSNCATQPSATCELACSGASQAAKEAQDKTIKTCRAFGGGGGGDSFWTLTSAGTGIFYSGGRVGINTSTPDANVGLDVFNNSVNGSVARFVQTNPTNSNGVHIQTQGVNGSDLGLLIQSNAGANDVFAVRNSGQVGIGTRSPTVSLDVRGGVRAGSDSEVTVCGNGVAGGEGTQRYNYTDHQMEYCNGSGWVPFQAGNIDWKTPDITYSRSGTTNAHFDLGSTHSKCLLVGSGTNNGGCYLFHPNQTGNPQASKWLLSLEAYGLNTNCIVNCWN